MFYANLFRVFEFSVVAAVYLASIVFALGAINSLIVTSKVLFPALILFFAVAIAGLSANYLLDEFGDGIIR